MEIPAGLPRAQGLYDPRHERDACAGEELGVAGHPRRELGGGHRGAFGAAGMAPEFVGGPRLGGERLDQTNLSDRFRSA